MVLRSVTVSEVMTDDGTICLSVHSEGEPELWTLLGLLHAGVESVRIDLAKTWTNYSDDD